MILLESIKHEADINSYRQLSNSWGYKTLEKNYEYPKHLFLKALKEFQEFCENMGIDINKYKYYRVYFDDPTYQVDFLIEEDELSSGFSMYNIYYDSRNKKILQYSLDLIN